MYCFISYRYYNLYKSYIHQYQEKQKSLFLLNIGFNYTYDLK